ncbi:MAG: sulfatase [Bacteroidales bacterium]
MKKFIYLTILILLPVTACREGREPEKPNIVIIFLDDSGWEDFAPFGEEIIATPHVSRMAREGCIYRNFYVPQAVCSASRSALLSGCYPGRTGVFGAHGPHAWGLDTSFATMGEVFQSAGYATAVFGKWHCGDRPETRPPSRGFDESCGLMYSNDMWKYHPENPEYWGQWPLQYWENGEVTIEEVTPEDQRHLTRWYTEHAVDFIHRHRDTTFLLYVPHSMPHVPIFCSEDFNGKSGKGLYWDVILELDWSVGKINEALKAEGLDERTIVIFSSDNGPWISYGNHAGRTPFREAKGTTFDGGIRSACIVKYPPFIEAGSTSGEAFCSIDLLPSLCHLADVPLPGNEIDGMNVWDLMRGEAGAVNPHDYYAFSNNRNFEGVISGEGRWKLHLPHPYRTLVEAGYDGMAGIYAQERIDTALFDMVSDPFETTSVLADHPEIAGELIRLAEAHRSRFYGQEQDE